MSDGYSKFRNRNHIRIEFSRKFVWLVLVASSILKGDKILQDEHNNLERTDILRRDDKAAKDLKNKPTTSYTGKGDTKREPSLDIFELRTVNLNLKNSTEKDSPSSSGRNDYNIDIINERVRRTPSSILNFSHILDNIDFIASPDGYIIHAKVERNLDETLKPIENNEDIIIKSPCRFVEDSTIIAESRVDESNDNINLRKTLTPQDRSILSPNDMVIFTNRDGSPTKSDLFENYDSEKMKILVTCEPESRTLSTISVSGSLPSNSMESIDDDYGSLCINNLTRKRRRNKKDWIANKSKTLKNSGQAYVGYHSKKQYPAKSVGSSCKFKLKCESVKKLQVIRNKNRTQTIRYYLPLKDDKVRVCTCTLYEQLDGENKESLKDKYIKHINNKERIREIKNSEKENFGDNSTLAIFDLEKVLEVPQSEVGIFHCKQKYPVYNFTVFDGSRKK
ncbi:unnamed protein product [Euphydryas editha]|uniref:Uncharacterized protein n=1 Tax=Euphydryas editha TaxID=104508 RepID=A0AAU9UNL5_EUPED|nr:unnamed protein product [Euphydryas editha]